MLTEDDNHCFEYLESINKLKFKDKYGTKSGCDGTFDGVLCWNATEANTTTVIPCPVFKGLFDTTKFLTKICTEESIWEGFNKTGKHSGYTDFYTCLTPNVKYHSEKYNSESQLIYEIVYYVELIGLIMSVLCISSSLFIFFYFKSLRCKRTKIHLNLLVTILIQSIIRLVFFLDRFIFQLNKTKRLSLESQFMVYNKAICPILTTLLEYMQTCNFMWMLNEGVYLNLLLSCPIFVNKFENALVKVFYSIGWGLPGAICISWAVALYLTIGIDDICWFGYYEWKTYWIIQAPILGVIIINLFFLINVIRILVIKLKGNQKTSDLIQIKKSAKAAFVLLPLLGITHAFEVYHEEIQNWTINLIFAITTAFLVFNQGVFISILYCFMNNEVKTVIKRHWLSKFEFKNTWFKSNRVTLRNTEAESEMISLSYLTNNRN